MAKRPKEEAPAIELPIGKSGLPNVGDFPSEVTTTKQTETNHQAVVAPSSERTRPTLTVLGGFDAGRIVALDSGEVVIGREAACHLVLEEPGVSRRHARVYVRDTEVFCEDLGSKNGTFIDGAPVTTRALRPGEIVHVGPNVTIRFAQMTRAEERLARELYDSSRRDPLTGAYNRRYFSERLKAELAYAVRHRSVVSVVMFDLDHFKQLNDTRGHAAGDAVLRSVVETTRSALRSEDVLARIGGEEFVFLLRGISRDGATASADRVRRAITASATMSGDAQLRVTISAGVATSDEPDASSAARLLALADARLYQAKAAGRNCVRGSAGP